MPGFDESPFHPGEEDVQKRTGAFEVSLKLGKAWHSRVVSDSDSQFLAEQQLLYLASRNEDGRLWASVVAGPTGFLRSDGPSVIHAYPCYRLPQDPAELSEGSFLGTTVITLETRQRHRLNGRIRSAATDKLVIDVEQSFGGCPKYIQAREVEVVENRLDEIREAGPEKPVSIGDDSFGEEQEQLIARADTLFLASCYEGPLEDSKGLRGYDISHRGGSPGFVYVRDRQILSMADYVGNFTFTTLGNIAADPRTAIVFLDFRSGDVLQLSGICEILWEDRSLPGAHRVLQFTTEKWVHSRAAIPLGPAGPVKWSPYNPLPTCVYSKEAGKERIRQLYNNYVDTASPYFVARCLGVTDESHNVKTFKFEGAETAKPLKSGNSFCDPGQFASFDFPDITEGETVNRTWTISSPQEEIRNQGTSSGCTFSVTIKKMGLVSNWMFDNMREERTVHFRGVDGDFTLDRRVPKPSPQGIMLIAGGIGITPMRVILHDAINKGLPATLLYAIHSLEDAVFVSQLQEVVSRSEKAQLYVTVTGKPQSNDKQQTSEVENQKTVNGSRPNGKAVNGNNTAETEIASESKTSHFLRGRPDVAMISKVCPDFHQRDIFLCGPISMMQSLEAGLVEAQFPNGKLHQEVFTF